MNAKLRVLALLFAGAMAPALFFGQRTNVAVDQLECLEPGENQVLRAKVDGDVPGSTVRVYFRRLHEVVEDFYFVELHAKGGGNYWGVLPKPEDEKLEERKLKELVEEARKLLEDKAPQEWDKYPLAFWWRFKDRSAHRNPNGDLDKDEISKKAARGQRERRAWMEKMTNEQLNQFFDELEFEPSEYFAAVYDANNQRIAISDLNVVPVKSKCVSNLTDLERGLAENLTIGETADWQVGDSVFHWLCEGVVTRIDMNGIFRGDDACRACVIAWWQQKKFLIPLAAGATATGISVIDTLGPNPASPSRP